jgi:hypothetical protein
MLLSARVHIDKEDYVRAAEVLEAVRQRSEEHSLRDIESRSGCLLGKVRAAQGRYEDAIALCTDGIDLAERLGQAAYDCRTVCADVSIGAGDNARALEFLGPALDEAALVYREKCPLRMRHGFMEAKDISRYVSTIEDILTGLGRTDEAAAYRAKFPLK